MMLALRIRRAEVAVKDGRLDEAYQQAMREDVREHRRGQRLVTRLTKALEARARKHLEAGNAAAAMADADRASRLGGNQTEIVAIQSEARQELEQQQNQRRNRHQKLNVVRNLIAAGNYTMGAKVGEELRARAKRFGSPSQDHTLYGIMQDAELEREQVNQWIVRGQDALQASLWDQALDALDQVQQRQSQHANVSAFRSQLLERLTLHLRSLLAAGRLDQAQHLLRRAVRHAPNHYELKELSQAVATCCGVAASVCQMQSVAAIEGLKSLRAMLPQSTWLGDAIHESETLQRSLESLRTGPLGTLRQEPITAILEETKVKAASPWEFTPPATHACSSPIPDRFLIHLDEAGSFLVIRSSVVSIGKMSSSTPVDVALQSSPGLARISIERTDDDYFFVADQPALVDGKTTTCTLLHNGSRIHLGRRGMVEFSMPHPASTSAALDLRGTRMGTGHVRRVLLMDSDLVLGPQKSAHICCSSLERAMVLYWRDGQLKIRPMMRTMESTNEVLAINRPHLVDGLSLVVTDVS